jgi:transposase
MSEVGQKRRSRSAAVFALFPQHLQKPTQIQRFGHAHIMAVSDTREINHGRLSSLSSPRRNACHGIKAVHGIDAAGQVMIRRQLKRRYVLAFFQKLPPCVVGIEACASSHYWSRELQALGHTVRLMPPVAFWQQLHKCDAFQSYPSPRLGIPH